MIANILTIAGTDPSGGAGIQADIKTFSALGTHATSAITAVVAQNTQGVRSYVALEPAFVAVRHERCVDRPRHRIFGKACAGSEVSRNEIRPGLFVFLPFHRKPTAQSRANAKISIEDLYL